MSEYNPDRWCLVSLPFPEGTEVRVLGGWSGGYLDGDYWRISSGVVRVEEEEKYWIIHNTSGSTYKCHKKSEGVNIASASVFEALVEKHKATRVTIEEVKKENT